MHEYLNWWIGGLALGVFTVFFRILTGNSLGVSGSWRKVTFWKQESANDKATRALNNNQEETSNALMAATLAEFGEDAIGGETQTASALPAEKKQAVPWTAHLVFLLSLIAGGALWAWYSGALTISFELSSFHSKINGNGWVLISSLLIGGFLVGFGTQMAGGCSSGHGLNGCASFSWPSLLATSIFFTTAVVVSLGIKALIL